jgi:hypothetical protein
MLIFLVHFAEQRRWFNGRVLSRNHFPHPSQRRRRLISSMRRHHHKAHATRARSVGWWTKVSGAPLASRRVAGVMPADRIRRFRPAAAQRASGVVITPVVSAP